MNIIELDQNEISSVCGGFYVALFGTFVASTLLVGYVHHRRGRLRVPDGNALTYPVRLFKATWTYGNAVVGEMIGKEEKILLQEEASKWRYGETIAVYGSVLLFTYVGSCIL